MISLSMAAQAKLNLALAVSPTVTNGKHLLQSVFTTIDLADHITFDYRDDAATSLRLQMDFDPSLAAIKIPQTKNIVYQALRCFEDRFDCALKGSLMIQVDKNIPTQGGLGGGSSDAAATLRAMQILCGIETDAGELHSLAAELGADVAFFLEGGCALMGGHGEMLLKRLALPKLDVVLVRPHRGLSTALVYQEFSKVPTPASDINGVVELLSTSKQAGADTTSDTITKLVPLLDNNLTAVAETLVPEIAVITRALESDPGILKALLTGSGSTVFGIATDNQAAAAAAQRFSSQGFWARACQTTAA